MNKKTPSSSPVSSQSSVLSPQSSVSVQWKPRRIPRPAAGVAATGEAARQLANRLLLRSDEELEHLRGVAGVNVIVVMGEADRLPWVDGACYLGHSETSAMFYLPTTLDPNVPVPLLEKALRQRFPHLKPPLVVLPTLQTVLSLVEARSPARSVLEAFRSQP
ncbi:MAG: hypothetical protein K1Y36_11395 [Blastocatellia bacterium]|nr:hypothetical protein [Blastocatellia bacterium]